MKQDHPYADILDLPHHTSPTRPRMSMADRAAQFSPFAALTGHDDAIRETARLTDSRVSLDAGEIASLDERLRHIATHLEDAPEVSITYFQPDGRKAGGAYRTVTGAVEEIDEYARLVLLADKTSIPIDDILDIRIQCDTAEDQS